MSEYTTLERVKQFYEVERTTSEGMPYILRGPRGAVYGLFRQINDDGTYRTNGMLFAMKATGSRLMVRLRGSGCHWVRE